jgi:hypothetical protein
LASPVTVVSFKSVKLYMLNSWLTTRTGSGRLYHFVIWSEGRIFFGVIPEAELKDDKGRRLQA